MMKLKSENVIQFLEVNQTKTNYYVMIELAADGSLKDLMKKGVLSEQETVGYLVQLLNGFGEMVRRGVTHRYQMLLYRDIKPDNVFVKKGVLKIGDFGLSKNK